MSTAAEGKNDAFVNGNALLLYLKKLNNQDNERLLLIKFYATIAACDEPCLCIGYLRDYERYGKPKWKFNL